MQPKKCKYQIMHISPAGEHVIRSFRLLKEAKQYVEMFPNTSATIVPLHGPAYNIEYYRGTFITYRSKQ